MTQTIMVFYTVLLVTAIVLTTVFMTQTIMVFYWVLLVTAILLSVIMLMVIIPQLRYHTRKKVLEDSKERNVEEPTPDSTIDVAQAVHRSFYTKDIINDAIVAMDELGFYENPNERSEIVQHAIDRLAIYEDYIGDEPIVDCITNCENNRYRRYERSGDDV